MPNYQRFNLPDVGEGLTEAEIVSWAVKPGDTVTVNQPICEIETAKSVVELPSPWDGVVQEILVSEGDTVDVGTPIVVVDVAPEGAGDGGGQEPTGEPEPGAADQQGAAEDEETPRKDDADDVGSGAVLVGYGTVEAKPGRRRRRTFGEGGRPVTGPAGSPGAGPPAPGAAAPPAPEPAAPPAREPAAPPAPEPAAPPAPEPAASSAPAPAASSAPAHAPSARQEANVRVLAKPPVRKLAKDLGVDLATVEATGEGGVITRADVLAAANRATTDGVSAAARAGVDEAAGAAASSPAAAPSPATPLAAPLLTPGQGARWLAGGRTEPDGRTTRVPIRSVRKRTAQAMVASAFTAPHVTVFHTVDITATMDLVTALKDDREFAGLKVTPLLIVMKALLLAVRRNPEINASWDEQAQEIVYKHYVNLGIAASTDRGLLVPNIKNAHAMTLPELARALEDLTRTAREGRTPPEAMSDGTITITNVGVFGVDTGTPILNPGEAAILAFGAVRKQPWVVEERIEPRWVTQLALAADHRLVDGDLAAATIADTARVLQDPSRGLVWG